MSERDCHTDEWRGSGGADLYLGGMSRAGRRCGISAPGAGGSSPGAQEPETAPLEGMKGTPRRSSIIKDLSVPKAGGRKKTVSFSSTPSERKVSSTADCLAFMQCGCELRKIRPNSRIYYRFYTLDSGLSCLHWEPSKKDADCARLDISAICEVLTGKCTDTFRHSGLAACLPEEAAFSIIHGDYNQSLDLVALSPEVANIWVTGLRYLVSHPGPVRGSGGGGGGLDEGSLGNRMRRDWLAAEFSKDDEDGYGVVSEDAAVATICRLYPNIKEAKVRLRFKEIQCRKEKLVSHVTLEEFQEAYCELCTRPDVYFLMVQLSQDRECLDAEDLRLFLETEQGLPAITAEGCMDIVQRFEPSPWGRKQGLLGLDGFAHFLQSPECQLFDPKHQRVCQDMNLPLTHYYISSSYHSYLSEDQGYADLGGLLSVLQAGCRCLEVGVTDGPGGEPQLGMEPHLALKHPRRASPVPITAHSAFELISKYAFVASPYPLLLYLCQSCSLDQQQVLAKQLKKVFGSCLYTPGAQQVPPGPERGAQMPSPEDLKGQVLLVGKKLPSDWESSERGTAEQEEEVEGEGELVAQQMATVLGEEKPDMALMSPPRQPLRVHICKELSDLLVMGCSSSFCSHPAWQDQSPLVLPNASTPRDPPCWMMCSVGEGEAAQLAGERTEDLADFTKQALMLVHPDSGNPNPLDYWKAGCQLVALKLQTPGTMLDLYKASFARNGGCGYVLRPAVMQPFSHEPLVPQAKVLRIRVISAHGLPKPQGSGAKGDIIDPYVVLELHGIPADCAEERTSTGAQNQDDPLFDETFEFQVNMPELAFLRFVVLDDDYITDDFIGQYSVSFGCLQPGFRTVPLLGLTGQPLVHASLFVHVTISDLGNGSKTQRRVRSFCDPTALRTVGIRALDNAFRSASAPLSEAADLRLSAKNAMVSFKEHCGLPQEVKLEQCIQSLVPYLQGPDESVGVRLVFRDNYPRIEVLGNLTESVQKLLDSYNTMISAQRQLIDNADRVQEEIAHVQNEGMEYHEHLCRFGEKEELKERKQSKALESLAWNITMLKGQCDLLCRAKADALDALRELILALEACKLMANTDHLEHTFH